MQQHPPFFLGLSIDTIAKCAFGVETDAHSNPDQDIIRWGHEAFAAFRLSNWFEDALMYLFFFFPGIEKYIPLVPPVRDSLAVSQSFNSFAKKQSLTLPSLTFFSGVQQAPQDDDGHHDAPKGEGHQE